MINCLKNIATNTQLVHICATRLTHICITYAIAKALNVTTDFIKNFNEDAAFVLSTILIIITLLWLNTSLILSEKYCSFTMKELTLRTDAQRKNNLIEKLI